MSAVDDLTASDLKTRLDRGEPWAVLDVREEVERAFCALPLPTGATELHVPLRELPSRLDEIRERVADRPLVVYCHAGVRSMLAARWLRARGLPVVCNLRGGIDAWSVDVDPSVPRY